jgi:hypothetical protein
MQNSKRPSTEDLVRLAVGQGKPKLALDLALMAGYTKGAAKRLLASVT